MTHAARTWSSTLAALAVISLATVAHAGGQGAPDAAARPHTATSTDCATGVRHETTVDPAEDVYVPAPHPAPPVTAPATPASEHPAAPAASAKPASARPAATHASKRAPAVTPHAKASIRSLPARPGMGTLLRVSITMGREIS